MYNATSVVSLFLVKLMRRGITLVLVKSSESVSAKSSMKRVKHVLAKTFIIQTLANTFLQDSNTKKGTTCFTFFTKLFANALTKIYTLPKVITLLESFTNKTVCHHILLALTLTWKFRWVKFMRRVIKFDGQGDTLFTTEAWSRISWNFTVRTDA